MGDGSVLLIGLFALAAIFIAAVVCMRVGHPKSRRRRVSSRTKEPDETWIKQD